MDSKYKSPFQHYGVDDRSSSLFGDIEPKDEIGKSLVSEVSKQNPRSFAMGSTGSMQSHSQSMEDIQPMTGGSHRSLYSNMGSGLTVHSAGSSVSMHSQSSGSQMPPPHMMSSTQYLAVSQQVGGTETSTMKPPGLPSSSGARPKSHPGMAPDSHGNPAQPIMNKPVPPPDNQPQRTESVPPSDDVNFYQKQIALQRAHAQQQHQLHVNQLWQQLDILSEEEKKQIILSLQKSTPSLLASIHPPEQQQSGRDKPKSDSDIKGKKSEAILPLFYTGAAGSTQKLDEEHLDSLQKTFGENFTENILPIPILLPTVVNPWVYKSYPVSLTDVVKINRYMHKKGRRECGEANIGHLIVEAINSSRDSLKASQGSFGSRSGQNVHSSQASSNVSHTDPLKAAFESTQSLATDKVDVGINDPGAVLGRGLAEQMGLVPQQDTTTASASCWSGTAAGPDSAQHQGQSGTSAPQATKSFVETKAAKILFDKTAVEDLCDNVDVLMGKKKKGKCCVS